MKAFIPAIVWGLIVFTLSVIRSSNFPSPFRSLISSDKAAHALAYFVLCTLLLWGFQKTGSFGSRELWLAFLLSAGFGIFMEIVQYSFFPYRHFELYDIIANIIGSLLGLIVFKFFLK